MICSKCKRQGDSNFRVLMKFVSVSIQLKASEMYIPVLLFVTLYKVVPTLESADEILKYGHSNES